MKKIIFVISIFVFGTTMYLNAKVTPPIVNCPSAGNAKDNNGHCVDHYGENGKIDYSSCLDATGGAEIDCKK
ncbi:MAG TPA: hypothetical protein PKE38_14890 [Ignavibacteriaceae bacterium]|nr:hypothetical protein [Ignavibacteriaceae bacterium]